MSMEEEDPFFAFGEGCAVHGDGHMRECTMCGVEFCARCFPRSVVCPDCADVDEDAEGDDAEGIEADDEVEALLDEADEAPDADLVDDEGAKDDRT